MTTLKPVDVAAEPYLSGRFASVPDEVDAVGLTVEGDLPDGLVGAYLRNGPNPMFPPLGSYTFPMEGDAMIHGVWFDGEGGVKYRNRWVRTKGMAADITAGKDIFGGLMTPAFVDPSLLGTAPDPGWPYRLDPFINVVRHAGRTLALSEGLPPYLVTPDLDTVGLFDFDGKLKGMCAHPRVDPVTGEMVVFAYDVEEPFLVWAVVGPDGTVTRGPTAVEGVDRGYMIHDFTITARYVILVLAPAVFDLTAMSTGGDILAWKPELGTRIACIPRNAGHVRWIDTDAFFVWHYGNAYDHYDDVLVDFSWWNNFSLGVDPQRTGAFTQARLSPDRGAIALTHLDDLPSEFARIDDRLTGRRHRYVTVSRKSGRHSNLLSGEFDQLVRFDMITGASSRYDSELIFGEAVHVPRAETVAGTGEPELDGWYITFATDSDATASWLLVWDAQAFPADPVARVRIPQRVPNGLHGNWIPAQR